MELFEESDVLELLSEVISEGLLIVDEQHEIVASNVVANEMFGYSKNGLNGTSMELLIPKKNRSRHKALANQFFEEGYRSHIL